MDSKNIELRIGERGGLARALDAHLRAREVRCALDWEDGFDVHAPVCHALAGLTERQRARVALTLLPGASLHTITMDLWREALDEARRGWEDPLPFDFLRLHYSDGRVGWYSRLAAELDLAVELAGADGAYELLKRHQESLPRWRETQQWIWSEPNAIPAELSALVRSCGVPANPGRMVFVRYLARGVQQINENSARMLQAANVVNAVKDPKRKRDLERVIAQTLGYALREDRVQPELQL